MAELVYYTFLFLLISNSQPAANFESPTFICVSGDRLEGLHFICDGRIDCHDGSDELAALCSHTVCPETKFKCLYGACVDRSRKCDGIRDCHDGSDEENCGRKHNSCAMDEFRCGSNANGTRPCILATKICDGTRDCVDGSDEATVLCENTLCPSDSFRCQYGGCVPGSVICDGFRDCFDGSDESTVLCLARQCPKCRQSIRCPPILTNSVVSARIDATCLWNDETVSCLQPMKPGTKAMYSCKEFYLPASKKHQDNNWNVCQGDGTWLRDILRCHPNCGQLNNVVPLIVNGWQMRSPLPWHASLYVSEANHVMQKNSHNRPPTFSCGATLISEAAVITAAHCIWGIQSSQLTIGLGNTKTIFDDTSDQFVRYYKAQRIIPHPLYLDKYGSYGSDIALIEIMGNVEFTEYLRPICIDWNLDDITSHLSDQSLGIGTGLGLTEDMQYSENLRALTMPVVSNQKCTEKQKVDFRKYITFTTFCAGWANGTAVCNGDSGGGLMFPMRKNPDKWCLQGIVSLSPRRSSTSFCDPMQYTIFTKVGIYVRWIRNVLSSIHEKHNSSIDKIQNGPVY